MHTFLEREERIEERGESGSREGERMRIHDACTYVYVYQIGVSYSYMVSMGLCTCLILELHFFLPRNKQQRRATQRRTRK